MSINSINHKASEQFKSDLTQFYDGNISTKKSLSQQSLNSNTQNTVLDSITISCSPSSQKDAMNRVVLLSSQATMLDEESAKTSVNSILSFIQTNGPQVLNSLKAPSSSVVLNMLYDPSV
jgi:hypothetical protein